MNDRIVFTVIHFHALTAGDKNFAGDCRLSVLFSAVKKGQRMIYLLICSYVIKP